MRQTDDRERTAGSYFTEVIRMIPPNDSRLAARLTHILAQAGHGNQPDGWWKALESVVLDNPVED